MPYAGCPFNAMKRIIAREVLLSYLQFDCPFKIYTDTSKHQLGAVIMQEGKPVAYYSRKLSISQRNYSTIEQELLAIVKTLKEFWLILLGQQITVYTDHLNLIYKVFNIVYVMHWPLTIEEYGPVLKYMKG